MVHFERSSEDPPCLVVERGKPNGRYDCVDVARQLKSDFKGKCYLCELSKITNPTIDHFVPVSQDPSRRLDWDNLFLCCNRCNSVKGSRSNLLDCTRREDQVDLKIEYRAKDLDGRVSILAHSLEDSKCVNTMNLLNDIYNGSTILGKIAADHLQDLLETELEFFRSLILQFLSLENEAEEKPYLRNTIHLHLQNSSAFTAFKRWIIRDNPFLMAEFGNAF